MRDLAGKTHGADRRRGSLQRMLGVRRHIRRRHGGELAARARDGGHHGVAVSDAVGLFAVRHNVDRAGDGDDRARLFGKGLGERDRAVKILLAHLVRDVSVHALGRAAAGGKGLDLGDVAADDGELDLFEELLRRLRSQFRRASAHGIEHDGVRKRVRALARKKHRLDRALVERADIDVQSTADRRDLLDLALVVRHDGRRAAGQHDVGAVVHRDIVRDVVDEGALASHVFEHFLKHICFSFLNKKQEAPTTGVSCKKP